MHRKRASGTDARRIAAVVQGMASAPVIGVALQEGGSEILAELLEREQDEVVPEPVEGEGTGPVAPLAPEAPPGLGRGCGVTCTTTAERTATGE